MSKPGKDNREVDPPSHLSQAEIDALRRQGVKFVNWHGFIMLEGGNYNIVFFNEVMARLNKTRSTIVAVCGRPGSGKTYAAMRLAEIFDPTFSAHVSERMCFSRGQLLDIISGRVTVNQKEAIIIDEGHISLGARSWGQAEQRDIVNQLATIRSRGILVFYIVLHVTMLDSIIRKHTLDYEIHLNYPGNADVYRVNMSRFEDKVYRPHVVKMLLGLPGQEGCRLPNCLNCKEREECPNMRAQYERNKDEYLLSLSEDSTMNIERRRAAERRPSQPQFLAMICEKPEGITYNKYNNVDPASVQLILSESGYDIGKAAASTLARQYKLRYPDRTPVKE